MGLIGGLGAILAIAVFGWWTQDRWLAWIAAARQHAAAPPQPSPADPPPALTAVTPAPPASTQHLPPVEKPRQVPARPDLVTAVPHDADGVALPSVPACQVAEHLLALPMASVRGASEIDVAGTKVSAVAAHQDDVVLLQVPGLDGSAMPLCTRPLAEGDELQAFGSADPGAAGVAQATRIVRLARDASTGRERFVVSHADLPVGAVLQDASGRLAGLFLGRSSDGQGIALPASCIADLLPQRQNLSLDQLRLFFHDNSAFSRRELGLTYVKLGHLDRAITELVRAIELEPRYREELEPLLLGVFRTHAAKLHDDRRDQDANAVIELAIHQYPASAELIRDHGVIQLSLGDAAAAIASLKQALALRVEDDAEVRRILERAYLSAGRDARSRREIGEAIKSLEEGAATFHDSGELRLELGSVYAEAGFLHDALNALLEAERLDPKLTAQAESSAERIRQSLASSGGVEIHFPPGSKAIRAVMRLNDTLSTDVIIDTGASTSVITRKVAEQLRIRADGPQVEVLTAGGRIHAPVGRLRSAAIGSAVVRDLEVVIVDLPDWDGTGGLVGLNFLDRFHTAIDFARGILTLSKR